VVTVLAVLLCSCSSQASTQVSELRRQTDALQGELDSAKRRVSSLEVELASERKRADGLEAALQQERQKAQDVRAVQSDLSNTVSELRTIRTRLSAMGEPFLGIRYGTNLNVASVIPGSPAHNAGILPGSTITYIEGVQVLTGPEMTRQLSKYVATDLINVTFAYHGQARTVDLVVGLKPRYATQ